MKFLKKMMQAGLAVFFFCLLATSTVFADTTGGQFVDKDNRKYYIKDDHKAIYWHKIDGKTYYFGDGGEMVVGWQYLEIPGTGYRDNLFDNQPVFEIGLQPKWYYFGQDGALQEFVGWKALEIKTKDSVGKEYGEKREDEDKEEKRYYTNYYFNQNHSLETGWLYDQSNWYYLAKTGSSGKDYLGGERRAGWINDNSTWYYLDTTTDAMQTGWQYLGNKWYYLRSTGAMATGWYLDGSTWYYLDAQNGDMKTGWIYVDNTWYYLRSSGAMVTGWFQVNGKWYYAYSSGALAVNTTVGGYYVNYNGEWVQ
ncbi:N-acetylmuramoyl-L-alanine amidase family protein [Streptococcus infantis]|uniref:N-acetylmuramoyl-L-alanine amidase family protein n=1 Tax=Streptococcus infantis TaxID=68892 RepID=UPI0020C85852|nr:N-acetylmuramoyl-L-alanine amidase family protein [Streptococcus infantis]MCP9056474.1 N-acetylmuramoyl-L-alanine amidase family protein [Streptococcus infantis]MCP9080564.1 N-acetylmuramoyl-L-alanine amidase family protein [Streptococcus infantis]